MATEYNPYIGKYVDTQTHTVVEKPSTPTGNAGSSSKINQNVNMADTGGLKGGKHTGVVGNANQQANVVGTAGVQTPKANVVSSQQKSGGNTQTKPVGTETTVTRADGTTVKAYIVDGTTRDANGNAFSFKNGDTVKTQGGDYVWNNGKATKVDTNAVKSGVSEKETSVVPTTNNTNKSGTGNKDAQPADNRTLKSGSDKDKSSGGNQPTVSGDVSSAAKDLVREYQLGRITDPSRYLKDRMLGNLSQADYNYIVGTAPGLRDYLMELEFASTPGNNAYVAPSTNPTPTTPKNNTTKGDATGAGAGVTPKKNTPSTISEASGAYLDDWESGAGSGAGAGGANGNTNGAGNVSGNKTIADMVKESGGKLTPEIVKADPRVVSNEDGTMIYIAVPGGGWIPIEQLDVPTYVNGGYAVNADTSEIMEDNGPQFMSYGDGSRPDDKSNAYVPPKGGVPTTVVRNGQDIPAYIIDGVTYDVSGARFQFQDGDAVNTKDGQYIWQDGHSTKNEGDPIMGKPYEGYLATEPLQPEKKPVTAADLPDTMSDSVLDMILGFLNGDTGQGNAQGNPQAPTYPSTEQEAGTATAVSDYSGMSDADIQQFIANAIATGNEAAIRDYMTWAEAQAIARERMNPLYDKYIKQQLDDIDLKALRGGFYGQLPTEALRQQAMAATEGDRTQAIIDYAQQLLDADREGVLADAKLSQDAKMDNINTLLTLLESNRKAESEQEDRNLKKYIADQDSFNTQGKLQNDAQQANNQLAFDIWKTIFNADQDASQLATKQNFDKWMAEFDAGNEAAILASKQAFDKWLSEYDWANKLTQQDKDLAFKKWAALL